MITMGAHLMMQPTLTVMELNTFQKKPKDSLETKIVIIKNANIQFSNV